MQDLDVHTAKWMFRTYARVHVSNERRRPRGRFGRVRGSVVCDARCGRMCGSVVCGARFGRGARISCDARTDCARAKLYG